ncbi:uncharacterized protein METZ01_LOCUS421313, partial [marine metagenome]
MMINKTFKKLFFLVGIIFLSGCFSPPNSGLNIYPKAVYTERGTHSNGHLG